MKKIAILGSTGSIGRQAIEVVRANGFEITALAANRNITLLEQQAREWKPKVVCVYSEQLYPTLKERLSDLSVRVVTGMDGLCEAATLDDTDITLNAVVGMIGLQPTLAAIEAGKDIALANKETLVTGGELVMQAAAKKGVKILPVDSEHSAIFQSLQGNDPKQVRSILLTASGGPFYGYTAEQLSQVTRADALKHPNWKMGEKITIDSATLMNKGLELIEAVRLFQKPASDIRVLIHRESILHSAVEYDDYSVIGQLGVPDMRIPIQYALTYPDRVPCPTKRLSLTDIGSLTFATPDEDTFVCLKACKEAITKGGLYPTLVNGANEEAVALFLADRIRFTDIGELVCASLELCPPQSVTLEHILEADRMARAFVLEQAAAK